MRRWAIGIVAGVLGAAGIARAEDAVVLMADDPEWATALRVELASRGAVVIPGAEPAGISPEARALEAERTASSHDAIGAVWIERDGSSSVRAIAAGSEVPVWAPLPAETRDSRVLALVAASLIDEIVLAREAPAAAPVAITVCRTLPTFEAAAGLHEPDDFEPPTAPTGQRGAFIEVGGALALFALGGEIGVGVFVHDFVRVALHGALAWIAFIDQASGTATASVAYVSGANDARFETGVEAGFAYSPGWGPQSTFGAIGMSYFGWSGGPARELRMGFRVGGGMVVQEGSVAPTALLTFYAQVFP